MALYHMVWRHLGRQYVEYEAEVLPSETHSPLSFLSQIVT